MQDSRTDVVAKKRRSARLSWGKDEKKVQVSRAQESLVRLAVEGNSDGALTLDAEDTCFFSRILMPDNADVDAFVADEAQQSISHSQR